ncbi:uncharacterized protein [Temnothorax longispinosus]|uniref:uncharacterized protein isoform X1 n=2 Tax=Temnothorax longispinosus TaxID=300112 RepID=UPI003A996990
MKLSEFLMVTWCSIIVARSEITESDQETLLKSAAEQLERLAPYRRTAEDRESEFLSLLETWKSSVDHNQLDGTKSDADQNVSWEMSEALPEQTEADATKRTDNDKLIIDVIADPRYAALMQDRIKRGFDLGSAGLLTSIAGGVLSGVASASSGSAAKASAGSSESAYKPVYGAPTVEHHAYSYEEKPLSTWDFKKAIFSTLFQALKAISGGVLALKGQLVKGGGYLLSGKGKVVAKAGDAITSFGKHLVASTQSKPYPEPYYGHPPVQHIGHEHSYSGAPPSDFSEVPADFSAHGTYGLPASDDNGQGGLLIVTKSDLDKHNDQHTNAAVQEGPAESFIEPTKSSVIKNLLNSVPKGSIGSKDQTVAGQDSLNNNHNHVGSHPPAQHPTYNIPGHYPANHNNPTHNYEQNYPAAQDGAYQRPELPQTTSHHHFSNIGLDQTLSIQPNVEYPPLQQIQYPNPHSSLLDPPKLPHDDDGGTSVYASLSVDTEPQIAPLKISLLGDSDAFNLPKLQPHLDFRGQHQFTDHLHGSLGGPLKVPLLNPMPSTYYWQSQGSLVPTSALGTLEHFRKRNVQRRAFAKRLARYASLQRLHRL